MLHAVSIVVAHTHRRTHGWEIGRERERRPTEREDTAADSKYWDVIAILGFHSLNRNQRPTRVSQVNHTLRCTRVFIIFWLEFLAFTFF